MCKYSNVLSKPALIGRVASLTLLLDVQQRCTGDVIKFRDLVCELE